MMFVGSLTSLMNDQLMKEALFRFVRANFVPIPSDICNPEIEAAIEIITKRIHELNSILEDSDYLDFDTYLHGFHKGVVVDGIFTLKELKVIAELAEMKLELEKFKWRRRGK